MSVISISSTAGLVLNGSFTNPIDILPGVSITNATGDGVVASAYTWTINNSGYVTGGNAFSLNGGALTNAAGAFLGGGTGVYIRGGVETVTNYGTIRPNIAIYDSRGTATVTNASSATLYGFTTGVVFYRGTGTVVNSGLINGHATEGIYLHGSNGQVTNNTGGFIEGKQYGIEFREASGTVLHTGIVDNAGVVTGSIGLRVAFINTVVNTGYISGTGADGDGVDLGGSSSGTSGQTSIITNEVSGRIKGYLSGVDVDVFNETLINYGHIAGSHKYGVRLGEASVVTNAASGTITAYANAVDIFRTFTGAAATMVNYGSITSSNGSVVRLAEGGTVTNAAGGTMTGQYGVIILGKVGTIVNDGYIGANAHESMELLYGGLAINGASGRLHNSFTGVFLRGDGTVINQGGIVAQTGQGIDTYKGLASITNAAGAYVHGNVGVYLNSGGTLTNAGEIVGTGGTAVVFAGFGRNLLAIAPSSHFQGKVIGSTSATNTLELLSSASTGVLNGLGTSITNFGTIAFDPGAQWQISGNSDGFTGAITGFAPGDVIEITGISVTGHQYFGGVLTLQEGAVLQPITISGNFAGETFAVKNDLAGAQISLACFVRGTGILTPRGEVEVEDLRTGDLVMAHAGDGLFSPRPVVWIGHRAIDYRRHSDAHLAWPVRIAAGAFGPGWPARDLWLSPDHAVFVDGVLVPVRYLVNGATIVQVACERITYFHVELAVHGVLLAEGMPCESYLDTGNRSAFSDGADLVSVRMLRRA